MNREAFMSSRIRYIDIAKGIAILAVIVGHYGGWVENLPGGFPSIIVNFVYTFHVPLFFIASGYFLNPAKEYNLAKEARNLLVPYLATCLLLIVLAAVVRGALGISDPKQEIAWWIKESMYGAGGSGLKTVGLHNIGGIGALWFLLALFWAHMFCHACLRMPYPVVWVLVLFLAGYYMNGIVWLPLSFNAGLCATLYVFMGYEIRQHNLFEREAIPVPIWLAMLAIWLVCIRYGGRLGLVTNNYPNGPLNLVGAICGTFYIVRFSMWLDKKLDAIARAFAWMGRNSLAIYCMHAIELIVFPSIAVWDWLSSLTGLSTKWVCLWPHFACIAAMCAIIYLLPRPISGIYFAGRRLKPKGAMAH
jgi:fucose 4-O-acetylase-like acetyltransferase